MRRQFALFCLSGTLAFALDAGVVQLLTSGFGVDAIPARLPAFFLAVSFTWWFNRRYTFSPVPGRSRWQEWRRYVLSQLAGLTVNFLAYSILVLTLDVVRDHPVLGVAAGACAGLVVNFLGARRLVFRTTQRGPGSAAPAPEANERP